MVNKNSQVYVLIGQDAPSKDLLIAKIKGEVLPKRLEAFNLDVLLARELDLKELQEKLLALPVVAKKRVVIIKEAHYLKEDTRKFLLAYCRKPHPEIMLILEMEPKPGRDEFVSGISGFARVFRSRQTENADTFMLWRQIIQRRADNAVRSLAQLLRNGEKPERILGGLRYSCLKDRLKPQDTKLRIQLLIDCDINIKTGRLRPDFALEKLVVGLCYLGKPLG